MKQNKVAIIQARMSSSRLPGKVLQDISGQPMLQHVIERTKRAALVDQVVLATTTDPSDDILEQYCDTHEVPCYRGSLADVLDRYYQAAAQFQADVVIRLTADCPLLDPHLLDLTLLAFLGQSITQHDFGDPQVINSHSEGVYPFDFCANRLPPPWQRTLPIGLDVEICSFNALARAWKKADQLYQREHVMPYLYEGVVFPMDDHSAKAEWYIQQNTTPRGFKVALLNHNPDYGALRWTVDTLADLEFVRQVYHNFMGQKIFTWQQVLTLLAAKPELALINTEVQHKSAFDVDERSPHSKKCQP